MAGEKTGLQLLDFWVSPFAQRCRIALAEKGLAYESLPQDLSNKGELLLRVNPAFPGTPPLLPADPFARAHARFWADYAEKKVFDCGTTLWKRTGQAQAQARPEMVEALRTLDAELGDKAYLAGEAFGFVDIAVVPFATWFLGYGRLAEFSVEEVCPRLLAWAKRCGERESVAKNLYPPEKVYEFIGYLKDTYGDK
ncbi:unnamed protein product [Miscanthus lutarioriparius]|uniref:Glutathione S-transferase n=1 Tax=Miscanthus lutarioriparius TaxID=422564 RepID=A0A811NQN2_9POAL|nr:unnamed protein product [Miscanthus lutarioriparius]